MNKKFNESEIILGRLPQNKVVPMLIIKANNEIFGLQLYKYKPQQETKNTPKNKKRHQYKNYYRTCPSCKMCFIHYIFNSWFNH